MTRIEKYSIVLYLLGITTLVAMAANDTIGVTAGAGKIGNLIKFGSNNVISEVGICDATAENQCAAVSAGGAVSTSAAQTGTWTVQPGNTANTTAWKVDGSAVTQPVSGTVTATVTGVSTAANQATEITSLASLVTNTAAAIPACATSPCTTVVGLVSNDPCAQGSKLGAPISATASVQVIAGTSAKKTYICSLDIISATAQNIALVEGTGSVCATNIFGLAGGPTAATGWNLAANGGLTKGSGSGTVYSPSADTNGTAANVCILLSSSGQTSGQITYVQQ